MALVKRCVSIAFGAGLALEVLASDGASDTGAERGVYNCRSSPLRVQPTQPIEYVSLYPGLDSYKPVDSAGDGTFELLSFPASHPALPA